MIGSLPVLLAGHSAAGELAGRSPGCGCWDRLLGPAAAAGSSPGFGCHEDPPPCVKPCDHGPAANVLRCYDLKS